jgi:chromosome condensin MukBEF MukE localization factor
MNEIAPGSLKVVPFPKFPEALADEATASIVEVLQEHLALAREGKLRSVAVVSASADGSAIGTQWFCAHVDIAMLIGKLTVLTHDMMAARQ